MPLPLPIEEPPPPVVETAPPAVEPDPPAIPEYYVHTVTFPGENLSLIAKWYTGDPNNWKKLAEYNPDLNPKRMLMGDEIQIPYALIIREEPMTKEFVDESQPGAKRHSAARGRERTAEPVNAEGVPLFGPRDYSR